MIAIPVEDKLSPVSPSATGKTLMSLSICLWRISYDSRRLLQHEMLYQLTYPMAWDVRIMNIEVSKLIHHSRYFYTNARRMIWLATW
ncbi:hypothetical protein [Legionella pneumophila]|uniref:hypothetical protein n=1 Tax=Legionella pneumophila TaxID=446 RepID=UPI0004234E0F|nr:hypothetical protein [Legionella pneumophila]